ncbi:MAG: branched-chain amino acid ABC transporter permease [Dehalococcoidia bacterium]|nr:MAG: branched-chain amino acid ABC transporter permease [Dehalococcoidia bacterium]
MHLPCRTFNETYEQDMAIVRTRLQWILLAAAIVFGLCIPLFTGTYMLTVIITTMSIIIAALGIQILTGYCGQLSVGHSAFVAVGAYSSALLVSQSGLSFWIAVPVAGIAAGLVGLLVGLTSIRLKGFYLIISTLAAQFIIMYVIIHWTSVTGGSFGMSAPAPKLGGIEFATTQSYFYIVFIALLIATYVAKNIVRTNVGRAFIAIRDNDLAAEVMGIHLTAYKLLAFFIGCAFAGIGGALAAHARGVITPDSYTLVQSFWYLGYIIIGGLGTITGVFFGVIFVSALNNGLAMFLSSLSTIFPGAGSLLAPLMLVIFGLVIILFLTFEPRGLAHRWQIFKAYYRLWPFSY